MKKLVAFFAIAVLMSTAAFATDTWSDSKDGFFVANVVCSPQLVGPTGIVDLGNFFASTTPTTLPSNSAWVRTWTLTGPATGSYTITVGAPTTTTGNATLYGNWTLGAAGTIPSAATLGSDLGISCPTQASPNGASVNFNFTPTSILTPTEGAQAFTVTLSVAATI